MNYKTIVLEWIQSRRAIHEPLRFSKTLLKTVNQQAIRLRDLHYEAMGTFQREHGNLDPASLNITALEVAFTQWEEEFQSRVMPNDTYQTPNETQSPTASD